MKNKKKILLSILDSKDKGKYLENVFAIENNIKTNMEIAVHFDIMDSKFVKNSGLDIDYISKLRDITNKEFDVHLMVEAPVIDGYIDKVIKYGADSITIHFETPCFHDNILYLKKKINENNKQKNKKTTIGVAINPETSNIQDLKKYEDLFDKILIMTVHPGLGGQKYIDDMNEKIKFARSIFENKIIQVDGGINLDNIIEDMLLNVDEYVIGSFLSKSNNIDELSNKLISFLIADEICMSTKSNNIEFSKMTLQIIPNGYGANDKLIGIIVGDLRNLSKKWIQYLNYDILSYYINSSYHEFRQFACFCLTNMYNKAYKKKNEEEMNKIYAIFTKNIDKINNWDLTDEIAPKILGFELLRMLKSGENEKAKLEISKYLASHNLWVRRIGIVSSLTLIKYNILDLPYSVCAYMLYSNDDLIRKANGWVLREMYKKDKQLVIDFLKEKNSIKKIPSITLSYACEKMTKEEKESIKK